MVPRVAEDLDERTRSQSAGARVAGKLGGSIDLNHRPRMRSDLVSAQANSRPDTVHRADKPDSMARGLARPRVTLAAGALIFAVSFLVAMLLTKPMGLTTAAMTRLASSTVSDLKTLMTAVKTAGLRGTTDVKGAIEEIKRIDSDRVFLKGWAVEIGDSTPLTVMVFVDGHNSLTVETNGRRDEASNALGLSDDATANVSFEGRLKCSRGQKLIVVAVARSDVYGQFGSRACP